MKILLIAGTEHQIILQYATKEVEWVNDRPLALVDLETYFNEECPGTASILLTDQAWSGEDSRDERDLTLLMNWIREFTPTSKLVLVTRDPHRTSFLTGLNSNDITIRGITSDWIRIPQHTYRAAYQELLSQKSISPREHKKLPAEMKESSSNTKYEMEKKKSFFDRFKPKAQTEPVLQATDRLTRDIANISRGISRIVGITGHRGSGVTSTVVNLASEAANRGLSAIIIDLDAEYRSMNMYFSGFHERTKRSEDMNASLIRTLARPQDYMTTAFNLKENLWLTSLGYGFHDRKLMGQFYTSSKLVGMLSLLRTKFNLVILDVPLNLFLTFKEALIHIDLFGLCVPNNLHAVLSTIRNVETVLDNESAQYLNAKSKIVVTKYNDRSRFQGELFAPDKVAEIMVSGLSENFIYEMSTAGQIPYSPHFDIQIENDLPLVNTEPEFGKAFGQMLLRMMEGA